MLRLHYWPAGDRNPKSPNWPIHTHAYELFSLVLTGDVRDVQYEAVTGDRYMIYAVSYDGDNSKIAPTDEEISVEPIVDELRQAGDQYNVPLGVYHQTLVPEADEAITLVVCTNFSDDSPLVLGSSGDQTFTYQRAEFSRDVFWDRIRKAIGTWTPS